MPISKVPIVHKFGIISHRQRIDLQERLKRQANNALQEIKKTSTHRNPLEVTEAFIQEFNGALSLKRREKMEAIARKMIERIKRRTGLKAGGVGDYVDLPLAWTELGQLAQCKGSIQENCLDVLIMSLDQAPLETTHIPVLFYLAESTLYWLRTEAVLQAYLRTSELKLLYMGQLVFTRLFYHYMAGQLQGQMEIKIRLFTYLAGFSDNQAVYAPYPNALLSMRYINEVGKMIIGDATMDAEDHVHEDDNCQSPRSHASSGDLTQPLSPRHNTLSDYNQAAYGLNDERTCSRQKVVKRMLHDTLLTPQKSLTTEFGTISSSVHDLSPTLWHALDVWRCVNRSGGSIWSSCNSLSKCGMGLASESWIDGIGGMLILTDSAKKLLEPLRVMQGLARGTSFIGAMQGKDDSATDDDLSTGIMDANLTYSDTSFKIPSISSGLSLSPKSLSDVPLPPQPLNGPLVITRLMQPPDSTERRTMLSPRTSSVGAQSPKGQSVKSPGRVLAEASLKSSEGGSPKKTDQGSLGSDAVSDVAQATEAATDLPTGQTSKISSVPTDGNQVFRNLPGIHGWHWEVAVIYASCMADICLHGATSAIKKLALMGNNKTPDEVHKQAATFPLASAGLLDLAFFHTKYQGPGDWSWRVRFTATQGLVKLCHCLSADPNQDGMRTVAWNTLLKAHSIEKDIRVLEALKTGQVDASIESLLQQNTPLRLSNIGEKMAAGLCALYLPPLPLPIGLVSPRRPWHNSTVVVGRSHRAARRPLRTTLGQEILLATALYEQPPDFATKADLDLHRVVEDQWRKNLQQELEEGELKRELKMVQRFESEEQEELQKRRVKKHQKNLEMIQVLHLKSELSFEPS